MDFTKERKEYNKLLRRVQRAKLEEIARKVDSKFGELGLRANDKTVPDYETPVQTTLHEVLQDIQRFHTRHADIEDNTNYLACAKCSREVPKQCMRELQGRLICNRC